jgi:hypothetical protein
MPVLAMISSMMLIEPRLPLSFQSSNRHSRTGPRHKSSRRQTPARNRARGCELLRAWRHETSLDRRNRFGRCHSRWSPVGSCDEARSVNSYHSPKSISCVSFSSSAKRSSCGCLATRRFRIVSDSSRFLWASSFLPRADCWIASSRSVTAKSCW